jgi:hypothetical protein
MSDTSVTPPAANVWDVNDIAQQALGVLRMDGADVDAGRVTDAADVATCRIDAYLDTTVPVDTAAVPELVQAAVELTVEVYRTKDAPWGVLDAWSADTVPVRISSDRLRSIRGLIVQHKERFGVG